MKNVSILAIAIFSFLSFPTNLNAIVSPVSQKAAVRSVYELGVDDIINLDRKSLQNKMGRKLTFKERISLRLVKRKLRKNVNLTPDEAATQVETNGLAIAGFVLGLLSIFIAGIILGLLGVIFSMTALNKIKRNPNMGGKGLAIAGLILGLIGLVGAFLVIAAM